MSMIAPLPEVAGFLDKVQGLRIGGDRVDAEAEPAGTSGAVRRTAVLVMDTSNSMRGEKIEAARSAALAAWAASLAAFAADFAAISADFAAISADFAAIAAAFAAFSAVADVTAEL